MGGLFLDDLAKVSLGGYWDFIDKIGNVVVPIKYDAAASFSEGLAKVELDDKYGISNCIINIFGNH